MRAAVGIVIALVAISLASGLAYASPGSPVVLYRLEVVDLSLASGVDVDYALMHDSSLGPYAGQVDYIADTVWIGNRLRLGASRGLTMSRSSSAGKPWLVVLPGHSALFTATLRHVRTEYRHLDESFTVKVTAQAVDLEMGRITTELILSQEGLRQSSLRTVVTTGSGIRDYVATLVQKDDVEDRTSSSGMQRESRREYAVFLSALAVTAEEYRAISTQGIVPVGLLEGLGHYALETRNETPYPVEITLIAGSGGDYRAQALMFVGTGGTWVGLAAGTQMGEGRTPAVAFGIGDETTPIPGLCLYAAYYPLVYRVDSSTLSGAMWKAGIRLGPVQNPLFVEAFGNPAFDGVLVGVERQLKGQTWVTLGFIVDRNAEPGFRLAVRFRL